MSEVTIIKSAGQILPEGAATYQPRAERSVALGWKALNARALKGRNEWAGVELACCFALSGFANTVFVYPGRRCALPWAGVFLTLRADLCTTTRA